MKFTEAAHIIAETPKVLEDHEAWLREAQRTWEGVREALDADPPALTPAAAAIACQNLLGAIGRTIEAPDGSPGRKTRGPDRAPRRSRKGPPGDGPPPPLALSDEDRAVLRSALETYGPLTLLALSEAFTVHKLTPLAMPLEEALTSTDEFCSWKPGPNSDTGGYDLWGTLQQFEAACLARFGSIADSAWPALPTAVTTMMDRMGCCAMAARRVLDMAIARRVAGGGK